MIVTDARKNDLASKWLKAIEDGLDTDDMRQNVGFLEFCRRVFEKDLKVELNEENPRVKAISNKILRMPPTFDSEGEPIEDKAQQG